jgi:hypothetical protein
MTKNPPPLSRAGARPRILLLSPFLYGEQASHGGAVLCWAQLKQLAAFCDLAFLGFSGTEDDASEARHRASLSTLCESVRDVRIDVRKPAVLRARLRSLSLSMPEVASLCDSPGMRRALAESVRDFRPDVVWIQFPQMAHYVQACEGVPCVMDVQDAYTVSAFRQAQRRTGLRAVRAWLDWVCWARHEARHYPRFQAVLTLSEQDAQVLSAMNPATPARCIGLPLGSTAVPDVAPVPMRAGFAGSFGHRPNVDGLLWFLAQVWPRVRSHLPEARFVIAGRNPPDELVSRADPGVEFAGFVPDIFDFYAANAVTVVPLVSGGGVKIKTVEAMLAGSAVVGTRIGLEGTGARPGLQALVEDEPEAFAEALARVLGDAGLAAGLRAAGLQHAQALFSADAWQQRARTLLEGGRLEQRVA